MAHKYAKPIICKIFHFTLTRENPLLAKCEENLTGGGLMEYFNMLVKYRFTDEVFPALMEEIPGVK